MKSEVVTSPVGLFHDAKVGLEGWGVRHVLCGLRPLFRAGCQELT
ncbi:Uncharacterised protein [Mycobacteroides abscessus subsp. abscessus]|nr:Uncharacterised protein [Mycobacteroides abscessus subsp. abscessus]